MKHNVIFQTVKMKNFGSFSNKETVISLDEFKTTLIVGNNQDEGGSSGAGKSTIMNAIVYALYDKLPIKTTKDQLVNRINKGVKNAVMYVILEFSVNDIAYSIMRSRGNGNVISIKQNGVDITFANLTLLNEFICQLIGISYEMFIQVVMFNNSVTSFLDLELSSQRNLIEELLKLTMLGEKADALKKEISNVDQTIKIEEAIRNESIKSINQWNNQIVQAENECATWDANQLKIIASLNAEIDALPVCDSNVEIEIKKHSELKDLELKANQLHSALSNKKRLIAQCKQEIEKNDKELKHLQDAKCPYCLQHITDADKKIADLIERNNELKASIIENDITAISNEYDAIVLACNEYSSSIRSMTELIKLQNVGNIKTNLLTKLDTIKNQSNTWIEVLVQLKANAPSKYDDSTLNSLKMVLTHQKLLLKLLTDKNSFIRKALINKTLPLLNKYLNSYMHELGLSHRAVFQSDMTCAITQYGMDIGHGSLSNGEKKRLNLALCLAFRDTMASINNSTNLLLADEVDGGSLDEQAIYNIIRILKNKASSDNSNIMVISHRPEFEGKCERTLTITKFKGFSTIG